MNDLDRRIWQERNGSDVASVGGGVAMRQTPKSHLCSVMATGH